VTGYEPIERVEERRGVQRPEHVSRGLGQPDLREERDAATGVAGNRCPVAEHEPPAFVPRLFGHTCEQAAGLFIGERQKRQLFVSVEPGDDTRRPPAELSGAGIEQNRARKRRYRHVISLRVSRHRQEPTSSNSRAAGGDDSARVRGGAGVVTQALPVPKTYPPIETTSDSLRGSTT
jgi:hypothetical protein